MALRRISIACCLLLLQVILLACPAAAQIDTTLFPLPGKTGDEKTVMAAAGFPNITFRVHNNGRFWNTVVNNGQTGNIGRFPDPLGNRQAPSFYYPRYSRRLHGFNTSLWIGGIVGSDTLVTTSNDESGNSEFWPDFFPDGDFQDLSNRSGGGALTRQSPGVQKYQGVFTDTFEINQFIRFSEHDQRRHKPLNLRVVQTSYTWPFKYAEDFMIIDYAIKNIGPHVIQKAWVGVQYSGAVYHTGELPFPRLDDVEGFIDSVQYEIEEIGWEPMKIAYVIDNDGQPAGGNWDFLSTTSGFGMAPLRLPKGAFETNFNWWVNTPFLGSWGPRRTGNVVYPTRRFFGGLGVPFGDNAKYFMMSRPSIDYPGWSSSINHQANGWLPPHRHSDNIARGHFVQFLLSFGPFTLDPTETEHFTVVQAIGEDIHTVPQAYREMFTPSRPYAFTNQLNMDDLTTNIRWAKRVYDNPGVDTDGDGDSGKFIFLVDDITGDSTQAYYAGDGVPDFTGATPPPAPQLRVRSERGKIFVRWNGRDTERFFDPFSGIHDFEGYRVYLARSLDEGDISLLASWDNEDYSRYRWNSRRKRFELNELPLTLDSLRQLYGEQFDPLDHPPHNPLYDGQQIFYFTKVDHNNSTLGAPGGIYKVYPDALLDTTDVDENGNMRYYEYELAIDNLLPTVPYWVVVTAFDFGHPAKGLEPLESSPFVNQVEVYAVDPVDPVSDGGLNVYVYPNPYRVDADYQGRGLENRFDNLSTDRSRTINFANLPHRCTISIWSLDGDLIKRFEHDEPEGSGTATIERFDLIGRNTQAVVSGLYYWVVESDHGNQIGKLVIIK
ncbi:MAG: hypothetical protein ACE5FH_04500 [Candidatus Zixiibacteriota bacterium]